MPLLKAGPVCPPLGQSLQPTGSLSSEDFTNTLWDAGRKVMSLKSQELEKGCRLGGVPHRGLCERHPPCFPLSSFLRPRSAPLSASGTGQYIILPRLTSFPAQASPSNSWGPQSRLKLLPYTHLGVPKSQKIYTVNFSLGSQQVSRTFFKIWLCRDLLHNHRLVMVSTSW